MRTREQIHIDSDTDPFSVTKVGKCAKKNDTTTSPHRLGTYSTPDYKQHVTSYMAECEAVTAK